MTTDEIEILLANTISEINRLSTSVENIRQVLGEILSQEQTHKDRERLKGLFSPVSVRRPISLAFRSRAKSSRKV